MQSSTEEPGLSLLDVSCRICVVAPAIVQATACVQRIISLRRGRPSPQSSNEVTVSSKSPDVPDDMPKIPWMISNKYYSAPVHFALHPIHGLSPNAVKNAPAVMFVWAQGESYKHYIERLSQDISTSAPDVMLAVRITSPSQGDSGKDGDPDDETEIDAFLSAHGFEFIDAVDKAEESTTEEDAWTDDYPGLERVVDALSTIMWPSMEPRVRNSTSSKTRDRKQTFLDWANMSQDSSGSSAEKVTSGVENQKNGGTKEMEELARWLEEDTPLATDPWKTSKAGMASSPTTLTFDDETQMRQTKTVTIGFDDDFTAFVSVPAEESVGSSGRSTPEMNWEGLSPESAHSHAGSLYRSLGSVSDLGDDENDNMKDELPPEEEVKATCLRIFGSTALQAIETAETKRRAGEGVSEEPSRVLSDQELESVTSRERDSDGYDMAPFDLSMVLNTLQEMKAEIATMENEDERRKAAARVALGLVYGLEADS